MPHAAPAPAATETKPDPRLNQSFAEATLTEPPDGAQRPPDVTVTGKRTGKLYTEVARLWDTIGDLADSADGPRFSRA